MLLEFKTKNYKSFKDELVFSMTPAPKQKGLDYSVIQEKIGKNTYKGLSSAVIYGPNASGKTNIIGAMDTFRSIILRGNIRNDRDLINPNIASARLELIPNNLSKDCEPVSFSIKFTEMNMLIEYSLIAVLGNFLDEDYPRKIISETLSVNEQIIFDRNGNLEIGSLDCIKDYLVNEFDKNKKYLTMVAKNNLIDDELFLQQGFKSMFSSRLSGIITEWLTNKFLTVISANALRLAIMVKNMKKDSVYINSIINNAAKHFGINSNALGYLVKNDNNETTLCSVFDSEGKKVNMPAEHFESLGTIRFVNLFPLILETLLNGNILVIDEFDASIHPIALMNIINIFHNNDININHAQLIFNTHNPIFLNKNLFRRDEIKFVERNDETHISIHYSLSDFGTSGLTGVRKNEDYMSNYFVDRYGAIKDIDFTPMVKQALHIEEDSEEDYRRRTDNE